MKSSTPVGAIIAVVLLALGFGLAGFFALLVLAYASDACGAQDSHLICTANGQIAVMLGPLGGAVLGTVIAAVSLAFSPPRRGYGIAAGYLIAATTLIAAWTVATAV